MSFPDPKPGLVIRYSYLWRHEKKIGREEGSKDRPCAIVLSCADMHEGKPVKKVVVLPITHRRPEDSADAVTLPPATKKRLGLDDDCSWVILNEANEFIWPGPDLRFLPGKDPSSVSYGLLPRKLFRIIRERHVERMRASRRARTSRGD